MAAVVRPEGKEAPGTRRRGLPASSRAQTSSRTFRGIVGRYYRRLNRTAKTSLAFGLSWPGPALLTAAQWRQEPAREPASVAAEAVFYAGLAACGEHAARGAKPAAWRLPDHQARAAAGTKPAAAAVLFLSRRCAGRLPLGETGPRKKRAACSRPLIAAVWLTEAVLHGVVLGAAVPGVPAMAVGTVIAGTGCLVARRGVMAPPIAPPIAIPFVPPMAPPIVPPVIAVSGRRFVAMAVWRAAVTVPVPASAAAILCLADISARGERRQTKNDDRNQSHVNLPVKPTSL